MGIPGRSWTKSELTILAENRDAPACDLARMLGRSEQSIHHVRSRRGLGPGSKRWTPEVLELLKSRRGSSSEDLAMELGRSVSAVAQARAKLGVGPGHNEWSDAERKMLQENRTAPSKELAARLGRSVSAIQQARAKLGFHYVRKWNTGNVTEALRQRHARGESLKAGYCNTNAKALYRAAVRLFTTWEKAIVAAGIDYERGVRGFAFWTKESIVAEILQRVDRGESLSSFEVQRERGALWMAACYHVGSWASAVAAAGVDYEPYMKRARSVPLSKDQIIHTVRELASSGEPLNAQHMHVVFPNLEAQARRKFGTWAAALKAAGLDYGQYRRDHTRAVRAGHDLEHVVRALLERAGNEFDYHRRVYLGDGRYLVPDFVRRDGGIWIDCKLNCRSFAVEATIEAYLECVNEVHIYFLDGKPPPDLPRVKFVHVPSLVAAATDEGIRAELKVLIERFHSSG